MLRTAESMNYISAALHDLRMALEGLVSDHHDLRQQLEGIGQRGRPSGRLARGMGAGTNGAPAKRGRKFKFTDAQAADFRKRVEGGERTTALAKELRISLPTMYNTLKRAGWTGRRGRRATGTSMPSRRSRAPVKRGRAFKFSDGQAAELRTQVDGGKSALALAQELKISLPTMYNTLKRAGWSGRRGRPAGRPARPSAGSTGPKKRGRAFKFSSDQAAGFRKRVEGGEKATALAKELKISVPTMYNTLKRAGWTGRKGRKVKAA